MAGEPPTPDPRPGAVKRRAPGRDRERRSRGGILAFLVASAIPVAAIAWFLLQPEARRQEILGKVPPGVGGRALAAAAAFGLLVVLARIALPAFHNTSSGLREVLGRMRRRPPALRALLFPVELLVGLVWFAVQILFAVDAFLILATALVGLLLVARIIKPDLLPDVLPRFAEPPAEETSS